MTIVRRFTLTKMELGVSALGGSYFVYDRDLGESSATWHLHCGPYSTFEAARDWILAIRETEL